MTWYFVCMGIGAIGGYIAATKGMTFENLMAMWDRLMAMVQQWRKK